MSEDGFASLLAAARAGDAAAWAELYHTIAPVLVGYLRAQRIADPDDVAGEVLLQVVRDLDRFDGDRVRFRSWVVSIAHHRVIDAARQARRRPAVTMPNEALPPSIATDDPVSVVLAQEGLGELEPVLATLTDDQRTVLLLRVVADLPVVEVARVLGRGEGAVKQLQLRAVRAMRQALDAQPEARLPASEPATDPAGSAGPTDTHGRAVPTAAVSRRPRPRVRRTRRDPGGPGNAPQSRWTP